MLIKPFAHTISCCISAGLKFFFNVWNENLGVSDYENTPSGFN